MSKWTYGKDRDGGMRDIYRDGEFVGWMLSGDAIAVVEENERLRRELEEARKCIETGRAAHNEDRVARDWLARDRDDWKTKCERAEARVRELEATAERLSIVAANEARTAVGVVEKLSRAEAEVARLREALHRLLGWTDGGACSDCDMFREAPSCIAFQHHEACAHLEDVNRARALLGMPPEEGHAFEDAPGEMRRLAEERRRR